MKRALVLLVLVSRVASADPEFALRAGAIARDRTGWFGEAEVATRDAPFAIAGYAAYAVTGTASLDLTVGDRLVDVGGRVRYRDGSRFVGVGVALEHRATTGMRNGLGIQYVDTTNIHETNDAAMFDAHAGFTYRGAQLLAVVTASRDAVSWRGAIGIVF